ncbi:Eukaryotic translation initiation factor 3 subunit E [Globomyces sp. JEL0801]|nr:Eukaryotic translation initiation factor 3 subunit E [Globomyces sp. JEL0801]
MTDLTTKISAFLEPQMLLSILDFQANNSDFQKNDVLKQKLEVLKTTHLLELRNQVHKQLNSKDLPNLKELQKELSSKKKDWDIKFEKISKFIQNPNTLQQIKQNPIAFKQSIDPSILTDLYDYALFQYSVGEYKVTSEALYHYRILSNDTKQIFSSLWGKIASEILLKNWDVAFEDLYILKDLLDSSSEDQKVLVHNRSWLLHWSLVIFFNHPKGKDAFLDLCLLPNYLNAIQTVCPWILRYVTAAMIMSSKKYRYQLKDLIVILSQEIHQYCDPLINLIQSLAINFDFNEAIKNLKDCVEFVKKDYYLVKDSEPLLESCRVYFFEHYCRIHQTVTLDNLAKLLILPSKNMESWVNKAVQETRLEVRISKGSVERVFTSHTVFRQIQDKTKPLNQKSQQIINAIEKKSGVECA